MAGTIKGIIVEIGGDTSGLQKALRSVNTATSSLSKELRGINSLLKLDPSNTELLAQKQTVLAKNIQETTDKLELLRSAQDEADRKIANGTDISEENYRNLQREIINAKNKLKQLQLEASNWTKAGEKLEEFGTKVGNIAGKIDNLGSTLTTSLTLPVLAIGTAAVTTGNDFEAQMSRVQAIAGATKDELKQLTDQAIDLGASTSFSASEVASGMENLASAGFTTQEIMEAMPGLLNLAASSGADLATSSEIAASAIRGFGLEASTSAHVADIFAEASARTNAQVEDMGEAMKYIAPVANTMGLKIEEVAAAIGIMSDAGIKGSQAGTTLRGALTRLTKPTDKMVGVMEDLGISFYDNEGKMKSLTEMISMLQDATKNLTDEQEQNALTTLFGTESLSGMVALINRGSGELSDMTKSFEDCDGAAQDMADTMLDNTKGAFESLSGSLESAEIAIQQALAPSIRDLSEWIQDLVDDFNDLSDEEKENIIKTALLVAAIGPAVKILGTLTSGVGKAVKGIGTLSQAIGVFRTGAQSANTTANTLAKGIGAIANPATLVATAIITATGVIITQINKVQEEVKNSLTNIGEGASSFISGISSATSYLDSFNTELFASSEEQKQLEDNMNEIQQGITQICKTASDERRDYTQEEITQLDEYFQKLRELKDSELEIQKSISSAISQQAIQNAENFNGSLEEYKVSSQNWIKTAQEQAQKEIQIINDQTTQEIALLQQRYGEKATMDNEAYANEYNKIIENKKTKIAEANDEVAKINQAYSNGYAQRASQNDGFYAKLQEYNAKVEEENTRHGDKIQEIEAEDWKGEYIQMDLKSKENEKHRDKMKSIWNEMYKNMSEEQANELGTWLGMVAQTELYGGQIDDKTKQMVDNILASYDSMPPKTQEIMKNAMTPLLDEMKKSEPSLYAKASSIANGIISRLKTAFAEHSPSKITRKIMRYAVQPMEEEMKKGQQTLFRQSSQLGEGIVKRLSGIDLSKSFNNKFKNINIPNMKAVGKEIRDQTKMIFTTPTLNIYTKGEVNIRKIADEVNRIFGSKY